MRLFYVPSEPADVVTEIVPSPSISEQPVMSGTVGNLDHHEVVRVSGLQTWLKALIDVREAGVCGLDLETTGLDPLTSRVRLVQLAVPGIKVYVADVFALGPTVLDDLAELLEDGGIKKIGHNLKFDLSFIQTAQNRRLRITNLFDTMLASQLIWAGYYDLKPSSKATMNSKKKEYPSHSLKALTERHLGLELAKDYQKSDWSGDLTPEQVEYAARDVEVLLPLHDILAELLKKNSLEKAANLEFRTLPAVVEMELAGLPLDVEATRAMLKDKRYQAELICRTLQEEAFKSGFRPRPKKGKGPQTYLNPDSPMDVKDYLRSKGSEIVSTREGDLKALFEDGCLFAGRLLQYRRISRQVAFLEGWLLKLNPRDDRLHPGYFQMAAATGRFSSRDPNAQQVPKRGEDGRAMRRLFRAPDGRKIVRADFSGIELRIMAYLSKDRTMLEAFQDGQDLHKLTASKVSGVPLDKVSKDQRQGAKAVNFLLIYGGSAVTLQKRAKENYGVEMSLEEAKEAHRRFFDTYPGIKKWHDGQRASRNDTKSHHLHDAARGYYSRPMVSCRTATGRKRVWNWHGGRTLATVNQLYNSPSQGTGADLIKAVMAKMYDILCAEGFEEVKMIGTIHDEILLEVPDYRADDVATKLKALMEDIGSAILAPVPVEAEVEVSQSWGKD